MSASSTTEANYREYLFNASIGVVYLLVYLVSPMTLSSPIKIGSAHSFSVEHKVSWAVLLIAS